MAESSTLIVVPTYNEREGLAELVAALRAAIPEATVLVVDDASPDGTGLLADELAARDPRVRVKHRPAKEGLGRAYVDAFLQALDEGWERIVQMDADFSHDPSDVPRLLASLATGPDLVIGSRYVPGGNTVSWDWRRRLVSRGGSWYARAVLAVGVRDLTGGFKAWRAPALRSLCLQEVRASGYAFQIEMTFRALLGGARVVEIPIRFVDRRVGQSKVSGTLVSEALGVVWKLRQLESERGGRQALNDGP